VYLIELKNDRVNSLVLACHENEEAGTNHLVDFKGLLSRVPRRNDRFSFVLIDVS